MKQFLSLAKHTTFSLLLLLSCLSFLGGCGFHTRSVASIPPPLHTLYLDVDKPHDSFNEELRATLISLGIQLVPAPQLSPFTLRVSHDFTHDNPAINSNIVAVTYNYSMKVNVELLAAGGGLALPPHLIYKSRQLTVSTSQIYIPSTVNSLRKALERDSVDSIYYWLSSNMVQQALHPK